MWATGSEISHGKIQTYGKGSGGNNTIIYDQQLVVSLGNKAHSVTLLCSSSLVLCNLKAHRLRVLYSRWIKLSMSFNLFLKFSKIDVNSSILILILLSPAVNQCKAAACAV